MASPDVAQPEPAALEPVARAARIGEIDFVRGMAVLGILLVNMPLYAGTLPVYFDNELSGRWTGALDQAALLFIRVVAETKFYTIFSFLFGLGFGVQMTRAMARGASGFDRLYARRLAILLAIGVVHLFLFWLGDVLHVYALVGFLLLLFRRRPQRRVLITSLALLVMPPVAGTVFLLTRTAAQVEELEKNRALRKAEARAEVAGLEHAYAEGGRLEVQRVRTGQVVERLPGEMGWATEVLSMFLLGLWVARRGFVEELSRHRALLVRLCLLGTVGVLATLLLSAWRFRTGPAMGARGMFAWMMLWHTVARPLHALFYAAGLALLVQQEAWRRRLAPLAAVGRMALTNYLMHTVICVTLFNGVGFGLFGFGLFGKVGFAAGLALTVAIWILQLVVSPWWLARYRFGPAEWLWRSLTYGRAQPMRLAA